MKFNKLAIAAAVCSSLAAPVYAGSELETLLMLLHENGTISNEQYQRVLSEAKANQQTVLDEKKEMQSALDQATKVEFNVGKGGLRMKDREGNFAMKIGGRLQVDSAWYGEDSDASGSQLGDGTEVRRARIYVQGKMYKDWGYKLQYDFTGTGNKGIKDAYLTYTGLKDIELKAGNFKDPFMLQEQTSSKHITFTERSLPDAFAAGRHIGLMASTKHQHWTAAAALFGDSVSTASQSEDEGWGAAGRLTYAPINEKGRVLHVGLASNYRTASANDSVQFKQQAETHVSGVSIVDTGSIANVDSTLKTGLELAVVAGPFSTQIEYIRTDVERTGTDLAFDGWYAEAAYFLTGETRTYKKGKFAGIKPNRYFGENGMGAWQLAARYSTINLNDGDIDGGEADSITLGVNWFPNPVLRFSANYVQVLDIKGGAHNNEEPSVFQLRGQWAF